WSSDVCSSDLKLRDVVVLTMSEFGRTVRENGNSGTDHGHATAMLVMGGPVNGGRMLGRWPGLDPADRFEGRDVAVTTDFRDLFAEVLARHLGAKDLAAIFPGFSDRKSTRLNSSHVSISYAVFCLKKKKKCKKVRPPPPRRSAGRDGLRR